MSPSEIHISDRDINPMQNIACHSIADTKKAIWVIEVRSLLH